MKHFFMNCIKGIGIGAGAILPGISSGVLCVIFGIYEKLLESILHFFHDWKKNLLFLSPLMIGGLLGVILFGNILNYLFSTYPLPIKSLFIGLILASIPSLMKEVHQKQKIKCSYFVFLLFAFLVGIITILLEKYMPISSLQNLNFIYLFICGFLMSVGIVVPGVSSTIILMLLGVYPIYLSSVSHLYLPILMPMGLGLLIGSLLFMKLTRFLMDHFYGQTFFSIIGFTLGSIFVLLPEIHFDLSLVIFTSGVLLGIYLFTMMKKIKSC